MKELTKRNETNSNDNFIWGIGSLLSVFSGYNNRRVKFRLCLSDRESMKADWYSIGGDIRNSIRKFEAKL